MAENLKVQEFYDKDTSTLSYIVYNTLTLDSVVIDPVLDFSLEDKSISYESIETLLDFINSNKLKVHYILDTHIHADHLTGTSLLKESLPSSKTAIGELDEESMEYLQSKYLKFKNLPYDILLKDNDSLDIQSFTVEVYKTPGHTASCVTYKIGENLFTGDIIFIPDSGTGRCDFPGGSSKKMYNSIKNRIFSLPPHYRIYVGHDYSPGGRAFKFETTVENEKNHNIHISKEVIIEDFIRMRNTRDKTLNSPRLLNESLYANINGGDIRPYLVDSNKNIVKLES